jgi:hypothetical protein
MLAYVAPYIVECRLRGIYLNMLRKNMDKAMWIVKMTIQDLNTLPKVDIDPMMMKTMENKLYGILINMKTKRYNDAHNGVRDLKYTIADI